MSVFLIISACDDDDELPEPTDQGENMMAFKIEDTVWEAGVIPGVGETPEPVEGSYNTESNHLILTGRRKDINDDHVVELSFREVTGSGEYTIGLQAPSEAYFKDRQEDVTYTSTMEHGGTLELNTLDTENNIAAGEFHFEAINMAQDEIEIEEGRFDIKIEVF